MQAGHALLATTSGVVITGAAHADMLIMATITFSTILTTTPPDIGRGLAQFGRLSLKQRQAH